jgi:hypothetical protein
MGMKMYAAAMIATGAVLKLHAGCLTAINDDEATDKMWRKCHEMYPVTAGWSGHMVAVMEINLEEWLAPATGVEYDYKITEAGR